MLINIIIPLVVTILSETLIVVLFRFKKINIYITTVGINVVTNLSLNIALHHAGYNYYYIVLYALEIAVFLIEGIIYYLIIKDFRKAMLLSLLCNLFSYLIGLLIIY